MNLKKHLLINALILLSLSVNAQTKRVLLEEYTGTACGNCPMGVYYIDSMQAKYDGVIAISLHSFKPYDAMNFPEIDTLFGSYAGGVPCGAIDRVLWPGSKPVVARQLDSWDTIIRNRLNEAALLTISLTPTWNYATRIITADVNVNILSDLPTGDYRLNLYVLEDSVTGTGTGYDQLNYYDTIVGNPFYGRGKYIIGYVHRHVARALLPSPWGLTGLIPSSASTGQNYSHTFNYTLPSNIKAERVRLIAYVYRYSSDHKNDEVLNADEKKLISPATAIFGERSEKGRFNIYPNPANDKLYFSLPDRTNGSSYSIKIINSIGKVIFEKHLVLNAQATFVDIDDIPKGIYIVNLTSDNRILGNQVLMILR